MDDSGRNPEKVNFYYTGDRFPAVSVTGSSCALDCKHCRRVMIDRLPAAQSSAKLLELCRGFHLKGATGVLLTGGCDPEGRVPLEPFLDVVKQVKEETGMLVAAHTGVIDVGEAKAVAASGVDCVCFDVVGSVETTREVYGIELYPEDYCKTLKALERAKIPNISPHVCVGLHNGGLFHEDSALELISSIKPTNVVIIGLTNLAGTPMEDVRIKAEDVVEVLRKARARFPDSFVSLGCARGKGEVRERIERMALRLGVDNMAVPSPAAEREAEILGMEVERFYACCAFLPEQLR